jgi:hypothetical protein
MVVPGPTGYVLLMRYLAVMPLKRFAAASSIHRGAASRRDS